LLKAHISKNPEQGRIIAGCYENGDIVPDNIVNQLIEKRLK